MTAPTGPGRLVVLSGPSGVGKGTVLQALLDRREDVVRSVSATTRAPRPGEVDGVHYDFVDDAGFDALVADDALLEWAAYAGNRYGTPRGPALAAVAQGRVVVLEIEVQGALQVRDRAPEALLVFLAPPDDDELRRRLVGRGTEDDASLQRRLDVARTELAARQAFDHVVINDDLVRCVDAVEALVTPPA